MTISRADWIRDTQWSESFLTPSGWERGTNRSEKGRWEQRVPPPQDCLLTVRYLSSVPSDWKLKPRTWVEIRWVTKDLSKLSEAQITWGYLPSDWQGVCPVSAIEYAHLPHIAVMQLPYDERPTGRRERRRRRYGGLG